MKKILIFFTLLISSNAVASELIYIGFEGHDFMYFSAAKVQPKNIRFSQSIREDKTKIHLYCIFIDKVEDCGDFQFSKSLFGKANVTNWPFSREETSKYTKEELGELMLLAATNQKFRSGTPSKLDLMSAKNKSIMYIEVLLSGFTPLPN